MRGGGPAPGYRPPAARITAPVTYDACGDSSQSTASGNFARLGCPPQWDARRQSVGTARVSGRRVNLGVGCTRRHRINPDLLPGDLAGKPYRERFDGGLRRGVVNVLRGRAERGRNRRDVDHHPGRPALFPAPDGFLRAQHRAKHVHIQDAAQRLNTCVNEATERSGNPGVVDERRNGAELRLDAREQRLYGLRVGNIAPHAHRDPTQRSRLCFKLARRLVVARVAERHNEIPLDRLPHDLCADSARPSGHQQHRSRFQHHLRRDLTAGRTYRYRRR